MKIRIGRALAACAVAAALGTTLSAATVSAETQSPIQIEHTYTASGAGFRLAMPMPAVITLSFRNEAPVTASAVEFNVTDGTNYATIDDVGSFATDVPVTHTYLVDNIVGPAHVDVAAVSFVDGTTWTAPPPLVPIPRVQMQDEGYSQ